MLLDSASPWVRARNGPGAFSSSSTAVSSDAAGPVSGTPSAAASSCPRSQSPASARPSASPAGAGNPQGGAPGLEGFGLTGGDCTQLAAGAGEGRQQLEAGQGAVAADEAVQGDTGRKVFQDKEPGRYVGGDNAWGKRESQIVGQELQGGQFGPQPPGFGAGLGGAVPHPFHDNRPGSASPPRSTRATAQGSRRSQRRRRRRAEHIRQEGLHLGGRPIAAEAGTSAQ